jgi:molybdopterin molybdotransferase
MRDMLGRGEALSVGKARGLILDGLQEIHPEETLLTIEDSFSRVVSRDIVSPEDLPGFARSTVDGFAVIASDTFGAGEASPSYLSVKHEILMGDEPGFTLKSGEAARIATGGMLPHGADAAVMLEHVQPLEGGMMEVQKAVAPGDNVIQKAEDVKKGAMLLSRGRTLRPQDVAVLAGLGITEVYVYERPAVAIISTGDEVVPPGAPVRAGLVRDMNSYNLAGLLLAEGCVPVRKGIVRDDYGLLRDTLRDSLLTAKAVLVSGGSSVGSRDVTEKVIAGMGKVLFHSVSMKPGKPMLAGMVEGRAVFGLPGHPRAVSVCFDTFVRPVLRVLKGARGDDAGALKNRVRARLLKSVHSAPGRQDNISVYLEEKDGELVAVPILGKSGLITTLVRAHGTLSIPEGRLGYDKGDTVEVALL